MSIVNLPKNVAFTPTCVKYKCFNELLYILHILTAQEEKKSLELWCREVAGLLQQQVG